MKKIIILLSVFMLVGCTSSLSSNFTIDSAVLAVLQEGETFSNTNGNGFKYYKPRNFSLLEESGYNHILLNNGNKYYLNIDINSYHNKYKDNYVVDNSLYYSYKFSFNDINGYVEIRESNKDYFYIKMMYNYSNIEVSVKEDNIKEAVINCAVILSSIKYNDKVIDALISSGDVTSKESTYEIRKPEKTNENKNILDVIDYDSYEGSENDEY